MRLLLPLRLKPGDRIGLAAPASPPPDPQRIDQVIAHFQAQGFQVQPGQHLRQRRSYLAGTDAERLADLHALFADDSVQAIFALRGGYGSCRLLMELDYRLIAAHPKPFIGYSDLTALHHALLVKTGLVTFHGPNANQAFLQENEAAFRRVVMEPAAPELFRHASILRPGTVRGRLLGGNLTCLLRLLGTPFAPDFRGAILFLEDTGEKAYRVDGLFTHLRLAGILDQIGALVLGRFDYPDAEEQKKIDLFLHSLAKTLTVPCLSQAPIGHFTGQITLPLGVEAELTGDGLRLLQPAVLCERSAGPD